MKHNEIKKLEKLEKNLIFGSAQQKNGEETHILICNFFFPYFVPHRRGICISCVSSPFFILFAKRIGLIFDGYLEFQ